jgi:hypothetical protein
MTAPAKGSGTRRFAKSSFTSPHDYLSRLQMETTNRQGKSFRLIRSRAQALVTGQGSVNSLSCEREKGRHQQATELHRK